MNFGRTKGVNDLFIPSFVTRGMMHFEAAFETVLEMAWA